MEVNMGQKPKEENAPVIQASGRAEDQELELLRKLVKKGVLELRPSFDKDGVHYVDAEEILKSADSGVVAGTTTWRIYRIDCTDVTSIKFYIDGNQVAATTTFAYEATGADAILQPAVGLYKASGTGVGTVQVDYIRAWQNRE